jgi:ADP-heptose:LPS heptosyltransferase
MGRKRMQVLPENPRILVVKFNAIGDLVMTTPAIRDLRVAWPDAHLALLVGSWSAPVMRHNPRLDEIIEFDPDDFLKRRWGALFRLLRLLRGKRFDAAIILHAPPLLHAFLWLAGVPLRFGMARGGKDRFLTASVPEDLDPQEYYGRKYQEVAALSGSVPGSPDPEIFAAEEDAHFVRATLAEAGIAESDTFLLVGPGGGRNPVTELAGKRWPRENFSELLRRLHADRPALKFVLVGAESDREDTSFLAQAVPGVLDMTGRFTLTQLSCVARASKVVLCNDSAMLHIGVACGTPAVAAFGPTSARQLVPPRALPYVWQSGIECSPCYRVGSGLAFPGCPIGFKCLRESGVEPIQRLVERALDA